MTPTSVDVLNIAAMPEVIDACRKHAQDFYGSRVLIAYQSITINGRSQRTPDIDYDIVVGTILDVPRADHPKDPVVAIFHAEGDSNCCNVYTLGRGVFYLPPYMIRMNDIQRFGPRIEAST